MQKGTPPSSTLTPEDAKRFELNRLRGVHELVYQVFIPLPEHHNSESQTEAPGRRVHFILVSPECKPEATSRSSLCDVDLAHFQAPQTRLASWVLL